MVTKMHILSAIIICLTPSAYSMQVAPQPTCPLNPLHSNLMCIDKKWYNPEKNLEVHAFKLKTSFTQEEITWFNEGYKHSVLAQASPESPEKNPIKFIEKLILPKKLSLKDMQDITQGLVDSAYNRVKYHPKSQLATWMNGKNPNYDLRKKLFAAFEKNPRLHKNKKTKERMIFAINSALNCIENNNWHRAKRIELNIPLVEKTPKITLSVYEKEEPSTMHKAIEYALTSDIPEKLEQDACYAPHSSKPVPCPDNRPFIERYAFLFDVLEFIQDLINPFNNL